MSTNATPATTLAGALAASGLTATKLARKCGVTRSAASQWARGRTAPSGQSRMLIARALKTPLPVVESWFTERAAA